MLSNILDVSVSFSVCSYFCCYNVCEFQSRRCFVSRRLIHIPQGNEPTSHHATLIMIFCSGSVSVCHSVTDRQSAENEYTHL